jgi:aspartate kinase
MKVLKFGGTSVGSPGNMRSVIDIITDGEQKIVVLSAMSGTTNTLVEISGHLWKKNREAAGNAIEKLESRYEAVVENLFSTDENKAKGNEIVKASFSTIKSYTTGYIQQGG